MKILDLTGNLYGRLLVLGKSTTQSYRKDTVYECKCLNCNTICEVPGALLTSNRRRSCGKMECRIAKSTMTKDQRTRPSIRESTLKKKKANIGRVSILSLPVVDQGIILLEFINGLSVEDISESYGVTYDSLNEYIKVQRNKFNSIYEIKLLNSLEKMPLLQPVIEVALRERFTNEELLKRLSSDDSNILSEYEQVYAWIYFQTGSNDVALKESGLLDCLPTATPHLKALLGMYLREKPNITVYLKQLQAKQLGETFIDKQVVQQELVTQIKQLKEIISVDGGSGNSRTQLLKCVELLGKTIGAFQENINVTEVKASDAIDKLIEMTRIDLLEGPIEETKMVEYIPTEDE